MKLFFLSSILAFFSIAAISQKKDSTDAKPYPIKSGRIVYKFINGPQSGTKTIIFDNWGYIYKEEVTTITDTNMTKRVFDSIPGFPKAGQIPQVQHNMLIRTPKEKYSIDLDRKIGYKSENSFTVDPGFFNDQMTPVGTDTLLGKPCKVYDFQQAFRFWFWGKTPLKKKLVQPASGFTVEEYAVEIDDAYVIKPNEFKVPANISIK